MPHRFPDGQPTYTTATFARLERRLPAPGDILVRVGTRVEPDELIGRCNTQPDPILIDIATALDVDADDIPRFVKHKAGARIAVRDVIARRRQHQVLAPATGVIDEIDAMTGFAILIPDPVPASVAAMLRGYVVAVEEGRSATIETPATVVQGAVGFGDEHWGTLRVLVDRPDLAIVPSLIDGSCAFAILVGGIITLDALRAAAREQVRAIVVGSVDVGVLRAFWDDHWAAHWRRLNDAPNPSATWDGPALVLTEGFGTRGMNQRLFDLLAECAGQEIYVDATTRLGVPQRRPRLIAPLTYNGADVENATPIQDVQPGASVRLLNAAHLGATARLDHVAPQGRTRAGVRTATATVTLANGEQIMVPASALDVLG